MPAPLRLEIEDQVATVTLDRPPVNALNLELLTGLRGLRAPALANLHAARPDGRDPVWGLWRSDEVQREISAYRARVLKRG